MKLVVGLGNPGTQYERTRHNVGFMVVDRLGGEAGIRNYEFRKKFNAEIAEWNGDLLVKPMGFMNRSGEVVGRLVRFYKIELRDVWVVHDDLDIPLGKFKVQLGRGPYLHNGVLSIEKSLGSKDFWRVRVGVENRERGERGMLPGERYVLEKFTDKEQEILELAVANVANEIRDRF